MCLDINKADNKITFKFKGDLNYIKISKIEQKVNETAKTAESVIFDLKDVKSITSSFFRICLDIVKVVGKNNFSIINVNKNKYLTQLFKISKFDKILNTDIER